MNIATTFIALNNGTKICVPAQPNLMSNFVLRELGDWFEEEIHFVRNFIKPGMLALDIGANYGLYSTAIAKNIGENGKLWCFEPTPNTAKALRSTIEKNNFTKQVELIEAGLSDHIGTATFYLSANAELNSLTTKSKDSNQSTTIKLLTLDQCKKEYNWQTLDFIKLDAEGEERNILQKATETLKECSPLIMFELKHGNQINHALINDFKRLSYDPYYLIPGLNILVPLDLSTPVDTYLLNLFCCKPDTAKKLENEGYLLTSAEALSVNEQASQLSFFANIAAFKEQGIRESKDQVYQQALNAYIKSRDETLSKTERYGHLLLAFDIAKEALKNDETKIERLSTYARIAFEIGQRNLGLQICNFVIQRHLQKRIPVEITEPYIPINLAFESTDQNQREKLWLLASFVDEHIRKHAFSCYFSTTKTIPYFNTLKELGFLLPDIKRREQTLLAILNQQQSGS